MIDSATNRKILAIIDCEVDRLIETAERLTNRYDDMQAVVRLISNQAIDKIDKMKAVK